MRIAAEDEPFHAPAPEGRTGVLLCHGFTGSPWSMRPWGQFLHEQGYAVAIDELEVGLTAVAAPIRNAHGDVVASMSVSGPSFRLPEERVDEVVRLVVEAAREVSHRLGWGHR